MVLEKLRYFGPLLGLRVSKFLGGWNGARMYSTAVILPH
jgi:hypothetical protein